MGRLLGVVDGRGMGGKVPSQTVLSGRAMVQSPPATERRDGRNASPVFGWGGGARAVGLGLLCGELCRGFVESSCGERRRICGEVVSLVRLLFMAVGGGGEERDLAVGRA